MSSIHIQSSDSIGRKQAIGLLGVCLLLVPLAIGGLGLPWLTGGESAVRSIANLGPCTNPWAFFAAWGNLGLLTIVLLGYVALGKLTRENLPGFLVFLGLSLLYLSFAREHVHYGDIHDYIDAARAVATGAPLPPRYVYPPLWAAVLARVWRSGGDPAVKLSCFFTNQFFLIWTIPLCIMLIRRLTQTPLSAAIITGGILAVNVPVIRNIVYVQINFSVLFLVLSAALCSRKKPLVSAALMALAIHLKLFPVLFLPAFIIPWRKRGFFAFGVWMAGGAGILMYVDGIRYFQDFVHNLSSWSPNPFRSSSITGFVANSLSFAGMPGAAIIAKLLTLPFIALMCAAGWRLWQAHASDDTTDRDPLLVKRLGLLMFLFPLLSPTVWPHHLIFLILPAATLLVHVRTRREATLFLCAFAAVFFMPVFDWYPWSYARLAGWLTLLVMYAFIVPVRPVSDWVGHLSFPEHGPLSPTPESTST
ncbi:MAG: glycosyltransferase family 87 protein [Lentisphaeria bacterium]|nr:glycosyltransferase family 87 protein [Lentisphaeria bacterium]